MDASGAGDADAQDLGVEGQVVHLVCRVDAEVVAHLLALVRAFRSRGLSQTVILPGSACHHALAAQLDVGTRTIVAGEKGWRTPRALLHALSGELNVPNGVTGLHVHGLRSCKLGNLAAKFLGLTGRPHLTFHVRRLPRRLQTAGLLTNRSAHQRTPEQPSPSTETAWTVHDVADVYFELSRDEAPQPLIVTASGHCDTRHVARFAQLAVLLQSTNAAFHWLGSTDGASAAQLAAAEVAQFDLRLDLERADHLRRAWLFVEPNYRPVKFPRHLAQAMAIGLPCVAWNTASHRALIEHGRTGLLCASARELLDCIVHLIDTAEVRSRIGEAAREEAYRRFNVRGRTDALISAYRGRR